MASPVLANPHLVAYCGLYCGACRKYLAGKCPGCRDNAKATWCKVRSCNLAHGTESCAACAEHADPNDCRAFRNPIATIIGFLLDSDRAACVRQLRALGRREYAERMAREGRHSLPRPRRPEDRA